MGIDFTRSGSGEPVVLVHGIGHRREAWGSVPDRLVEAGFDVVAIDLPGFGQSELPAHGRFDIASTADAIEALFAELGLYRPHVVGNSLGGAITLYLAGRGTVRSATALAPAGFWTPGGFANAGVNLAAMKAAARLPEPTLRRVAASDRLRGIGMAGLYRNPRRVTPGQFVDDTLNLRDSPGFWPTFRTLARPFPSRPRPPVVPTTVAWGDHDRILLTGQAKRAARQLPQATHLLLPGCGHVPMVDDPAAVVRVVRETAARVDQGSQARKSAQPPVGA